MKPRTAEIAACARSFLHEESGQALVIVALALVVILGAAGLALDIGQMRLLRHQLQVAADAAALAGAQQLAACGATPACSAMQTAVRGSLTENGIAASTMVLNCAAGSSSGVVVALNNGPCALGAGTDPNSGNVAYVETVVSKTQPVYFGAVLGIPSMNIVARAESALGPPMDCMYALDPSGAGALTVAALAAVYSPNCGIMVESSSSSALSCALLASVTAAQISVVGGYSNLLCSLSPTPVSTSVPSPADPLSSLPTPAQGACGVSVTSPYTGATLGVSVLAGQTVTFYPGTYCGGITIALGATVTFQPGTYVLTSKNGSLGLTISCGATVTGSGVTFYNYGPSGAITFLTTSLLSGGVRLTAPLTGTYAGILFFQDARDTTAATLIGDPQWSTTLEGAYYFPSATVLFALDGVANYSLLVAKDIKFLALTVGSTQVQSGANNNNDYSSLGSNNPFKFGAAYLIQ